MVRTHDTVPASKKTPWKEPGFKHALAQGSYMYSSAGWYQIATSLPYSLIGRLAFLQILLFSGAIDNASLPINEPWLGLVPTIQGQQQLQFKDPVIFQCWEEEIE